jgi:hypothetical protein
MVDCRLVSTVNDWPPTRFIAVTKGDSASSQYSLDLKVKSMERDISLKKTPLNLTTLIVQGVGILLLLYNVLSAFAK